VEGGRGGRGVKRGRLTSGWCEVDQDGRVGGVKSEKGGGWEVGRWEKKGKFGRGSKHVSRGSLDHCTTRLVVVILTSRRRGVLPTRVSEVS